MAYLGDQRLVLRDLRSEHQKGKKRKRSRESETRKLAWRGGGTGTRTSRIGWARLRRPLLGLFIGGIPAPARQLECFLIALPSHIRLWPFTQWNREGNGTPPQYSCLENPVDGEAWWAAVHGVAKSRTRLGDFTFTFHSHALEKGMATHSSVLAWRIPGMGEPGGLSSMGSRRVGHD